MSQITGSHLTGPEAEYLRQHGINPTTGAIATLDPVNLTRAHIISVLCSLHPADSYHDVPLSDIVLALSMPPECLSEAEAIIETIAQINKAKSNKMASQLRSPDHKWPRATRWHPNYGVRITNGNSR